MKSNFVKLACINMGIYIGRKQGKTYLSQNVEYRIFSSNTELEIPHGSSMTIAEQANIEQSDVLIEQKMIDDANNIKSIDILDNSESNTNRTKDENTILSENILLQQKAVSTDLTGNCSECCALFQDSRRTIFGYQIEEALCKCHDICVEDIKDVCVKKRIVRQAIPSLTSRGAGCRGGVIPNIPAEIESLRVLCAEECFNTVTQCDRIINTVEFELVLRFDNTLIVVTPRDEVVCMFFEFARFPSGTFYSNNPSGEGLNQFRNELAQIDGSCKVIIIEQVFTQTIGNNYFAVIEYILIDKLWKRENLLVSAMKPYAMSRENINFIIKQEFSQEHKLGACPGKNSNEP